MPRVNLGRDPRDDNLRMIIEAGIIRRGFRSKKDVADAMHMPPSTFYLRYKKPELFTFGELKTLCAVLKVPAEEKGKIL